jgi:hypothetical protein
MKLMAIPLTTTAFKTIKKRMNGKQEGPVYIDGKTWYVCVPIRKKMLNCRFYLQ